MQQKLQMNKTTTKSVGTKIFIWGLQFGAKYVKYDFTTLAFIKFVGKLEQKKTLKNRALE